MGKDKPSRTIVQTWTNTNIYQDHKRDGQISGVGGAASKVGGNTSNGVEQDVEKGI